MKPATFSTDGAEDADARCAIKAPTWLLIAQERPSRGRSPQLLHAGGGTAPALNLR